MSLAENENAQLAPPGAENDRSQNVAPTMLSPSAPVVQQLSIPNQPQFSQQVVAIPQSALTPNNVNNPNVYSHQGAHVITMQHVNANPTRNGNYQQQTQLYSCCKPTTQAARAVGGAACPCLLPILVIYALIATLSSTFLLDGYLGIPGLQNINKELRLQVSNLTEQVDRLEENVDDLTQEVDNLDGENSRLESSVDEYVLLNMYLEQNITKFAKLNKELNETVENISNLNDSLERNNEEYKELNRDLLESLAQAEMVNANLTSNIDRMEVQLNDLESFNDNLTAQLHISSEINQNFTIEVRNLETQNDDLSNSVMNLTNLATDLTNQTIIMENQIAKLSTIVQFINNTAGTMGETLEGTVTFLSDMIVDFQKVMVEDLEVFWQTMVFKWRCDLDSAFGSKAFTQNTSVPIGAHYQDVFEYLDRKIFQKMCVDLDDMQQYINEYANDRGTDPSGLTVSRLSTGIAFYYLEMDSHYFSFNKPDTGIPPGPLSMAEWELARYDCRKLPESRRFKYYEVDE